MKKETLINEMQVGKLYENAHNVKFEIIDVDERCIILQELEPNGNYKYKEKRRFTKDSFAGLLLNKSFATTLFKKRETYYDLHYLDVNKLFNK